MVFTPQFGTGAKEASPTGVSQDQFAYTRINERLIKLQLNYLVRNWSETYPTVQEISKKHLGTEDVGAVHLLKISEFYRFRQDDENDLTVEGAIITPGVSLTEAVQNLDKNPLVEGVVCLSEQPLNPNLQRIYPITMQYMGQNQLEIVVSRIDKDGKIQNQVKVLLSQPKDMSLWSFPHSLQPYEGVYEGGKDYKSANLSLLQVTDGTLASRIINWQKEAKECLEQIKSGSSGDEVWSNLNTNYQDLMSRLDTYDSHSFRSNKAEFDFLAGLEKVRTIVNSIPRKVSVRRKSLKNR